VSADRPDTPHGLVPVRPGAILLVRHGEPALSRRVRLDSEGYRRWWALYEEGGLLEGQSPPDHLAELAKAAHVFCSTRKRAQETAGALADTFHPDETFIEAPLPPPWLPSFLKLSPRTWGVVSRVAWWLGHHQGQETRPAAQARARAAAALLSERAAEGKDVMLLAHGFFNAMIGGELKRRGWRCVRDEGYRYWSQRRFERN
jgi:broad specificity phosphatase PhoE